MCDFAGLHGVTTRNKIFLIMTSATTTLPFEVLKISRRINVAKIDVLSYALIMETKNIFETLVFISILKPVTAREYYSKSVPSLRSRENIVGIATGYGLDDRGVGVRVPVWSIIISSPRRPDRFRGPPTSYPMGTGGSFPGGKSAGA
jgi:hypothetical protein